MALIVDSFIQPSTVSSPKLTTRPRPLRWQFRFRTTYLLVQLQRIGSFNNPVRSKDYLANHLGHLRLAFIPFTTIGQLTPVLRLKMPTPFSTFIFVNAERHGLIEPPTVGWTVRQRVIKSSAIGTNVAQGLGVGSPATSPSAAACAPATCNWIMSEIGTTP